MNPENIARHHQFREGFELVDYAEVGLPIFRLTLEAVTMAHKPIPTIHEFVMRAIEIGENNASGIATFLGLDSDLVAAVLRTLRAEGTVTLVGGGVGEDRRHALTDLGNGKLIEERQYEPQEEMLVIDYDGIRRKPIWLGAESVVRAGELSASGALQIRPYPASPPDIGDLNIPEVARVVRRQAGSEFSRDVLALKRVVRRASVFRHGTGLVFRNRKTREIQIAFVIGGRLAEDYELEFARRGGPKKMGLVRAVEDSDAWSRIRRRLGSDLVKLLPDPQDLAIRRAEVADARAAFAVQLARMEARGGLSRLKGREAEDFNAESQRLAAAERALDELQLRPLAPYEQPEMLEKTLAEAEHEIFLTSAGLHQRVAGVAFLQRLDALIERGVRVVIQTSYDPRSEVINATESNLLADLVVRSARHSRLTLGRIRRGESLFFLIKDSELAVVSNRSFLGGRGKRPSFFCISGVVSTQPAIVRRIRKIAGLREEPGVG